MTIIIITTIIIAELCSNRTLPGSLSTAGASVCVGQWRRRVAALDM